MTRYSYELLGYAFALFSCYGLFVSLGLSRVGWCRVFMLLGLVAALAVMVRERASSEPLAVTIVVVFYCVSGSGFGWGGHEIVLWTVGR